MKVTVRQSGDVTILYLKGKLVIGSDMDFRNSVRDVLNSGATKIVVHMRDVSTIDSSGLGELVSAYTTASTRGARIKLAEVPSKVTDLLTITQLITVFEVYDREDEAVRSFA